MNKQDLVEYVQKAANIETKVAATAAVNGETIKIKATKVVSFKVGSELKATAKKAKVAKK